MSRQAELNHNERLDRLEDLLYYSLLLADRATIAEGKEHALTRVGMNLQALLSVSEIKIKPVPVPESVRCSVNSERLLSLIARLNHVLQIDAEQLPAEWQDTENMYIRVIEDLITSKRSDQLAEGLAAANEDVRVLRSYIQNLAFTAGIDESEFNELGCEKVSSLLEQVIQDSELYRRKLAAIRAAL